MGNVEPRAPRGLATDVSVAAAQRGLVTPAPRIAVEIDGYADHHTRSAFERDLRRDTEVLATAGLSTMRITWRQLANEPEAVVARLATALARSS